MQAPFQGPAGADAYHQQTGKEFDLREPYRLPAKYLKGLGDRVPALAPTVVLINSNSGGRTGPAMTAALRRAIGQTQVRTRVDRSIAGMRACAHALSCHAPHLSAMQAACERTPGVATSLTQLMPSAATGGRQRRRRCSP